jgi:transcriptional regulator with XRE-family HTH domain
MNESIYPEQIKRLRNKKKWSQEQLVRKIKTTRGGITKRQLQRLEQQAQTGNPITVRTETLDGLAAGLGVKRKLLMQPPSSIEEVTSSPHPTQKLTIRNSIVNNLKLIQRRYCVPAEYVLQLAPLLFVYHAESSLRARRIELDQQLDLFNQLTEACPSLSVLLPGDAPEELIEEMRSIEMNDLIGCDIGMEDEAAPSRFTLYLQDMVCKFNDSLIIEAGPPPSSDNYDAPSEFLDYILFDDYLESVSSGNSNIKQAILDGSIRLDKLPNFDLKSGEHLSPEQWIRDQYERLVSSPLCGDAAID